MGTSLKILRENGNVPKSLPGEDHITGLVFYMAAADIPDAFKTERVQALSTIDAAEAVGITADAASWTVKVLHYQLSELYRLNPAVSLYVGIFEKPQGAQTFAELKTVQNFAAGRIRQIGVWCGDTPVSGDALTALQEIGNALAEEEAELSIVYAPKVADIKQQAVNLAGENKCRVSVVIGQAGSGTGAELYKDEANAAKASVSGLGVVMGLISAASVHQSIAYIKQFPTGVSLPAFGDGTLVRDVDKALIETLDNTGRYLFFVTHTGLAGSYMNDSHTMDKAVRGIRTYIKPELGGNVYVDASTGQLASYTVAHLETVANQALEAMERAGELSGYKAEIDPAQDVASSGTVEIVIKNVAVPVMRHVRIKIGFAKTV